MTQPKGYGQFCPIALAAQVLTERWTPLVVRELLCGSVRFNELQRLAPDISHKVLAETLRTLEAEGLIARVCEDAHVAYAISAHGRSLRPLIDAIHDWGETHLARRA